MAQPQHQYTGPVNREPTTVAVVRTDNPAYQAFRILQFAFVVAPIIAGLDKFFDYLVNWDQYLAPIVTRIVPVAPHMFMQGVGVIEIVAGILVAFAPQIFGYVVAAWLVGIIGNLLMARGFYDIALRDLGLALGALALARLGRQFQGH
jgi:hypothetical protein